MPNFLDGIWEHGNRTALIDSFGQTITYATLKENVDDFSSCLSRAPAVAIITCRNVVEALVAYLSFIDCGIVPILLPSKPSYSILQKYVFLYKPEYLFLDFKLEIEFYHEIEQRGQFLLYALDSTFQRNSINPNLKILLTTSGSTGNPKLVRLSDNNLRINCEMIHRSLPMKNEDIAITTLPFNYSYGLSIINTHFLKGATVQLNEYSVVQRQFWELLIKSKATTFGGVPFLYQQIAQVGFDKLANTRLRYLTQAGGKMPTQILNEIYRVCEENTIDFFVMYGQTEATARMSVLHPVDAKKRVGSIGKAIYPGTFSLVQTEDDLHIQGYKVGELEFCGGSVALGYATTSQDLNIGDEWCGILNTGDLAYADEDGFVYLVGRISRFSKIRGVRISLDDLESRLLQFGKMIFALEVGEVIFLVSTEVITKSQLKEALNGTIGIRPSDFELMRLDSIPRTAAGKIDYNAMTQIINSKRYEL